MERLNFEYIGDVKLADSAVIERVICSLELLLFFLPS